MKQSELLKGLGMARVVPGGVTDAQGKRLYVPNMQGGIVALTAATGEPLWSSSEADLPLLVVNGSLLTAVYREEVNFILLNVATGERMQVFSSALRLAPGSQWWTTAVWGEGREIRIAWQSLHSRRVDGAPLLTEDEGIIAIDLDTGSILTAPVDLQPESQKAYAELTEGLTLFRAADGSAEPWHAGNYVAALVIDDEQQCLQLVTWNLNKGMACKRRVIVPSLPRSGYLQHHRSPDVENVFLLLCNDREENGVAAGTLCHWQVVRVSDGKPLMTMTNRPGLQPPLAIVGNSLLYIETGRIPAKRQSPLRRLCAVDIATGEMAWSCDIGQKAMGHLL